MAPSIKLFALSTCIHCKKAIEYMDENNLIYDCVHVDKLEGVDREDCIAELKEYNPGLSFPTIIIGESVVVGFKKKDIERLLEREA